MCTRLLLFRREIIKLGHSYLLHKWCHVPHIRSSYIQRYLTQGHTKIRMLQRTWYDWERLKLTELYCKAVLACVFLIVLKNSNDYSGVLKASNITKFYHKKKDTPNSNIRWFAKQIKMGSDVLSDLLCLHNLVHCFYLKY